MKNITIMGGGVLGSQIAFQAAYCGFDVTIWLRSEGSIGRTQPKLDSIKQSYIDAINLMDIDKSINTWCMGIAGYDDFDKENCLEKVNAHCTSLFEEVYHITEAICINMIKSDLDVRYVTNIYMGINSTFTCFLVNIINCLTS